MVSHGIAYTEVVSILRSMNYYLNIQGYWADVNRHSIPCITGVYFVFACIYNPMPNTVTLKRLLYIGQAIDVNSRIAVHDKRPVWASMLALGETVCYSVAAVDGRSLDTVEAALVYKLRPPTNELLTRYYSHAPCALTIMGQWPYPYLTYFNVP